MSEVSSFGYHELERTALGFVLEDETWPVFLEWMRQCHVTPAAHIWLVMGPDLEHWRDQWALHSGLVRPEGGDGEHKHDTDTR